MLQSQHLATEEQNGTGKRASQSDVPRYHSQMYLGLNPSTDAH